MENGFNEFVKTEIAFKLKCKTEEVYTVWQCKTLQNIKGVFYSTVESAKGLYFEAAYNGDKEELYLDMYSKLNSETISIKF